MPATKVTEAALIREVLMAQTRVASAEACEAAAKVSWNQLYRSEKSALEARDAALADFVARPESAIARHALAVAQVRLECLDSEDAWKEYRAAEDRTKAARRNLNTAKEALAQHIALQSA